MAWQRMICMVLTLILAICEVNGIDVGVNYGMLGNDLPSATDVISLYKKYNIEKLRLFDPNPQALQALKGSNITVILGVPNQDMTNIASSQDAANSWYSTNVAPYINDIEFTYIAVGNEAIPGDNGQYIGPAMQNLQAVLTANNLHGIEVTTVVATSILGISYPPSAGAFSDEVASGMTDVLQFLSDHGSSLMVNVYPYFAYAADPTNVRLDYANFAATTPVVTDGSLGYYNLFGAIVDAVYSAMEKQGFTNVDIGVSETGWPSAGNGDFTTPALAETYNKGMVTYINNKVGTPKRPNTYMDAYIFAMFNENQKPAGVEQNWGLFYSNMEPVYPVF